MRVIYNKLSKEIFHVIEDDNSISSFPPEYTIIQGDKDEILKIGAVIGLDLSQIDETMTEELKRVYKDRAFGEKMINLFLEENKRITISTQEIVTQLQAFVSLKALLETGAITTARDLLSVTSADAFLVCPPYSTKEERKTVYLAYLNNYLDESNG